MSEKKSECRLRVSGAENPGEDCRETRLFQFLRLRLRLRLRLFAAVVARLWTRIARRPRLIGSGIRNRLPTI